MAQSKCAHKRIGVMKRYDCVRYGMYSSAEYDEKYIRLSLNKDFIGQKAYTYPTVALILKHSD